MDANLNIDSVGSSFTITKIVDNISIMAGL